MCPLLILMHSSLSDPVCPAWSVVARLPVPAGRSTQIGVAGPFSGISGNALIVAGGSNFPDKKPWEGGKKEYVDEVYILERRAIAAAASPKAGAAVSYKWYTATSFRLPQKLAYGASVTVPEGVLCIGGENAGGYSKKVFLLHWASAGKQLHYKDLPDLPIPLANAGAALIGNTVYLAGGENATRALASFFCLDLTHPTHWQTLRDLPVALSHTAAVAVTAAADPGTGKTAHASLYLIGGRSKTASGISTLHNTVFHYDPSMRAWSQMHSIGDGAYPPDLAAANAVADDDGGILVIGGDDGRIFHELEALNVQLAATADDALKRQLQRQKLAIIDHHPGFWRGILRYDPAQDRWTQLGDLPMPAPVTTTAVRWDNVLVIPCGEVKPGTRSADILLCDLQSLTTQANAAKSVQP